MSDGSLSGSFTLTAQGGDVSGYSIENPSSGLSVSPTSGSLSSGQSVTISLSASSVSGLSCETDLSVSPGGLTVAVDCCRPAVDRLTVRPRRTRRAAAAAACVIADSLPNATSRGRYFIPQSGASTRRSAAT